MRSRIIAAMAAISIGGAALWVFRGSLGLFFAQEDFRGLAVAKGLLPRHEILWRYVSVQSFMDLFYPILGDEPRGYHWVSLGLHGANAMALFVLLHRRLSLAASFVAATFFAAHSTLFTAMYWLSARSDILATAFSLCTIGLALRRDRWRWLALVSHTCALLSKESVILLPAVVWLVRDWASMDRSRSHDRLMLSLGAVSIGFAFYLLAGRAGIGIGTGPSAPYAIDFAGSLVHNLLTYVGWVVDVAMKPSPLRFLDVQDPDVYGMALGGLAVWGIGCLVPGLRARGWVVAGAGFLLLLLPVLPLRNHTYHYFLYAPLMAAAWCLGAAFDMTLAHRRAALSWSVAGVCFLVLAWNGERLVRRMETRPRRVYPALRGDPIVSRSIVAHNVIEGLRRAGLPPGTTLVFVLRERIALLARIAMRSGEAPPPTEEIYPEANLRTAVFDGYGVRALVPAVDRVAFARDSLPISEHARYAIYTPTGEVDVFSAAQLDSLLRSSWITKW